MELPYIIDFSEEIFKPYTKVSDKDINHVFQMVREIFEDTYFIKEKKIIEKKKNCKSKEIIYYTFMRKISDDKCQVIQYYSDTDEFYKRTVRKSYILTTLFGLLSGYNNTIAQIKEFAKHNN